MERHTKRHYTEVWTILVVFCGVYVIRRRLSEVRFLPSLSLLSSCSLWYLSDPSIPYQSRICLHCVTVSFLSALGSFLETTSLSTKPRIISASHLHPLPIICVLVVLVGWVARPLDVREGHVVVHIAQLFRGRLGVE